MATLNPGLDVKDVLVSSMMGLCGEAGEAIDLVKKHLFQGHELDKAALIKELGYRLVSGRGCHGPGCAPGGYFPGQP